MVDLSFDGCPLSVLGLQSSFTISVIHHAHKQAAPGARQGYKTNQTRDFLESSLHYASSSNSTLIAMVEALEILDSDIKRLNRNRMIIRQVNTAAWLKVTLNLTNSDIRVKQMLKNLVISLMS